MFHTKNSMFFMGVFMVSESVVRVLSNYNFWSRSIDTGLPLAGMVEKIRKLADSGQIVAIIGARRSGKTTLCLQYLKQAIEKGLDAKRTLFINLEDPAFEALLVQPNGIEEIYKAYREFINPEKKPIIILDEVQNVKKWEKWARAMHDKKEAEAIIVTGSSSELYSGSLATLLTGRTLTMKVFPLGFKEYLEFKGVKAKENIALENPQTMKAHLIKYLSEGGFPKIVVEKNDFNKKAMLKEYFEGIIYRDVAYRNNVKDVATLKILAELCINNVSSLASATKMREYLIRLVQRKISPNKVVQYMGFLEEAFMFFFVPIFSYKVREQKLYPKKIYCIDNGLANSASFKFSEGKGQSLENSVFLKLKRESPEQGTEIFYWRGKEQKEVDFVIKKGLKVMELIQVCAETKEIPEREITALQEAMKEFSLKEGKIITWEHEEIKKTGKTIIKCIPLWKWLLL